jgi:hypothetical protein
MNQMSFGDAEYRSKRKQTRREKFLAEMEQVVPWDSLLALIEPFYPVAGHCVRSLQDEAGKRRATTDLSDSELDRAVSPRQSALLLAAW